MAMAVVVGCCRRLCICGQGDRGGEGDGAAVIVIMAMAFNVGSGRCQREVSIFFQRPVVNLVFVISR